MKEEKANVRPKFEDGRPHDRAWICQLSRDCIAGEAIAPRPPSCALYCCAAPDSDHDPDHAFFFLLLLFYFLAFFPISLIAHVRSSPLPFRPLAWTPPHLPVPSLSIHLLGFLAHMSVWFTTPCLHLPLLVFGCTAPSRITRSSQREASPPFCLRFVRQGLPLAFYLRRTHSYPSTPLAYPVPLRPIQRWSRSPKSAATTAAIITRTGGGCFLPYCGFLKHTRINGANASTVST